jgi:hypothetical protein
MSSLTERLVREIRETEAAFPDAVVIGTLRGRMDMIQMYLETESDPARAVARIREILEQRYRE